MFLWEERAVYEDKEDYFKIYGSGDFFTGSCHIAICDIGTHYGCAATGKEESGGCI